MTNPAPIKPFNGKPADSLQGTDISPAQAYKMTLDEFVIDEIIRSGTTLRADGGQPYIFTTDEAVERIKALIAKAVVEARINELEQVYPQLQKHYGVSGEGNYYYDDRIAELKAQQEQTNDQL